MCNPAKAVDRATGTQLLPDGNPVAQPVQQQTQPTQPTTPTTPTQPTQQPATPDYTALANDYTQFYQPQVQGQYNNALDALNTGLAEKGLSGSNIAKGVTGQLGSAYASKMASLPTDASTYAHSSGATGNSSDFSPLGDLFTSIVKPVATFNNANSFNPNNPFAPAGPGAFGTTSGGAAAASPGAIVANGNTSRVVS